MKKPSPHVYVIAGPNGSGKTTFAKEFLPSYARCKEFVNADLIAGGLSPFAPEAAVVRAGRLLLEQIELLANRRSDFGFETTLSGVTYASLLRRLKDQGYQVHLFFLWIPSVEVALARIADRIRMGGHNIPEDVVRRRYRKGLYNLFTLYRPLLTSWMLFDNSELKPRMIARDTAGKLRIFDPRFFAAMLEAAKR